LIDKNLIKNKTEANVIIDLAHNHLKMHFFTKQVTLSVA